MNAVEIEEAVTTLARLPFDAAEFPFVCATTPSTSAPPAA